jgi:predicted solute-binding protein
MYDEAPVELTDELGRLVYKQVITPIVFAVRQVAYYSTDERLRLGPEGTISTMHRRMQAILPSAQRSFIWVIMHRGGQPFYPLPVPSDQ